MPIPKTDIATALYGSARAEEAVRDRQRTSTVAARATSDSSGGRVLVDFGGASVTGDGMQSVEVPRRSTCAPGTSCASSSLARTGRASPPP